MIKVENNGGKGNPYHSEATGEFSSPNVASSSKKTNFSSNTASAIKHSQPLSIEERNNLNQLGMMDKYMQQSGKDKIVNDKPSVINDSTLVAGEKKFDFPRVSEILSDLPFDKFKTLMRFVLGRFNFMVFAPGKKKLNSKVFKTKQSNIVKPNVAQNNPQKLSTSDMQKFHQEGVALNNDLKKVDEINATLDHISQLKDTYEKKFGRYKKDFRNWWDKSKMRRVFNDNKRQLENIAQRQKDYNAMKQNIQNMAQRSGK